MLPKKAIDEFKDIYKKEFNVDLPETEAIKKANNLIDLFKLLSKPKNKPKK